jgi:hypothetical protein
MHHSQRSRDQQLAIEEHEDRDSEDPDESMYGEERKDPNDSEINEDRYRQMDPRLEAKIKQIKYAKNVSDQRKEDPYHMKPVDYQPRSNAHNSKSSFVPSTQNAATTVDD